MASVNAGKALVLREKESFDVALMVLSEAEKTVQKFHCHRCLAIRMGSGASRRAR